MAPIPQPPPRALPRLIDPADFLSWHRRIDLRLRAMFPDLVQLQPADWPCIQQHLVSTVLPDDELLVYESPDYDTAMTALFDKYIPCKTAAAVARRSELYRLAFFVNESVPQLIARAKKLASEILMLGGQVADTEVLTAVLSAVKVHPVYGMHLTNLQCNPTINIDLNLLHRSFHTVCPNPVPTALAATAAPPPPPSFTSSPLAPPKPPAATQSTAPTKAELVEVVGQVNKLASSMLDLQQAMAASVQGINPDRRGVAQRQVAYDPYRRGQSNAEEDDRPRDRDRDRSRSPVRREDNRSRDRGRDDRRTDRDQRRGNGKQPPKADHCRNCGSKDHFTKDCRDPCSQCGSKEHTKNRCPANTSSVFYDPAYVPPPPPQPRSGASALLATNLEFDPYSHMEAPPGPVVGQINMVQAAGPQALGDAPMTEAYPGPPPGFGHVPGFAPDLLPADMPPIFCPAPPVHATIGEVSAKALMVCNGSKLWVLDSGATNHVTPIPGILHDYVPDTEPCYIKVADARYLKRAGVGHLWVKAHCHSNKHMMQILDVWLIPGLSQSLLSVNCLKAQGYWHTGGKDGDMGETFYTSDNVPVMYCPYKQGLNVIEWDIIAPRSEFQSAAFAVTSTARSTTSADAMLWHCRLGHANHRSIGHLLKHNLIQGIQLPSDAFSNHSCDSCEACLMAKMPKAAHKTREHKALEPLEVLHSDVCGQYPVKTLGGGQYVVTLLDEFTGFVTVGILCSKKAASIWLRVTIEQWEAVTGKRCKVLYTDRGGEYVGNDLKDWCLSKGVQHNFTVTADKESNGAAERLNQTLNNMMRAMMFTYNSYAPLWGHAITYATLIKNVSYSSKLGMTPFQAFLHKVPDVSKLKVFGCRVLARVQDTHRKKLDPKAKVGIYLGPCQQGPGHEVLLYDPSLRRNMQYAVVAVRDIVAFERMPSNSATVSDTAASVAWGGIIPLPKPIAITGDLHPDRSMLQSLQPVQDSPCFMPGPATMPPHISPDLVVHTPAAPPPLAKPALPSQLGNRAADDQSPLLPRRLAFEPSGAVNGARPNLVRFGPTGESPAEVSGIHNPRLQGSGSTASREHLAGHQGAPEPLLNPTHVPSGTAGRNTDQVSTGHLNSDSALADA